MDPTQLQLALNFVMITGVTSLASYCYLLKKENRKLATQRSESNQSGVAKPEAIEAVVPLQSAVSSPKPARTVELDIRTLASARRTRWVKGLTSSIS
jgi:hypothetical protein